MNFDKFSRRSPSGGGEPPAEQAYDFSQIAQEAVSSMRAQQSGDEHEKDEFAPRRPRGFSRRSRGEDDAPRREFVEDEPPVRERKPFGFGRRSQGEDDAPRREFVEDEPPVRERKPFGFGRRSQGEEDAPRREFAEDEPPVRERRPFGFGRRSQGEDDMTAPQGADAGTESRQPAGEHTASGFSRHHRSPGENGAPERPSGAPRRMDVFPSGSDFDDFDGFDDFDDFDDDAIPPAPAPSASPAAPTPTQAQSGNRVFNAATQPNYSYMTDYGDQNDRPAHDDQEPPAENFLSSLKAAVARRLGKDEPGVEYYTPPADRTPYDVRRRQKRRNRRPLPMWAKMAMFGVGLAAAFVLILYLAFFALVTGRINYVGESSQNPVYLSVEEYANLQADLTDTEENAAEFTEPFSIAEPSKDVKVIMVVSSDGRIGDAYAGDGRKITNESAKTDSIMLVAIDNANRRIRVASIMTDTYVRIQDYKTNKLSKAYYYDTANGDYTLPCLRQAVKDNFGVIPDNYVVVDFSAFQILINRLGGIDIDVSADEAYYMSAHERYGDFPRFNSAGTYKMSGPEALNYARMRAVGNDDFDRSARQRYLLKQILAKIGTLSALEKAELAYAMLPELPTDMSAGQVFGYLSNAADLVSYEVTEVTFPITNSWRYGTASVRSEYDALMDSIREEQQSVSGSDAASGSDVVSDSDLTFTPDPPQPRSTRFTVIVTNFQFNATVLQKYLYENDESYLNGTAASGVSIPEIIAPLEVDSPAAGLDTEVG